MSAQAYNNWKKQMISKYVLLNKNTPGPLFIPCYEQYPNVVEDSGIKIDTRDINKEVIKNLK